MIDDFISYVNGKKQGLKLNKRFIKEQNGCYVCTARHHNEGGYPTYKHKGKSTYLHRIIYQIYYGKSVEGKVIRHTCDNPSCINPLHLKSGTHADNIQDRVDRDRSARGEKNGRAKLTKKQVLKIRRNKKNTITELARKHNVCRRTIRFIRDGITWKHCT